MRKRARGNASPSPWPPPRGGVLIAFILGISLLVLREWCSTPAVEGGIGFSTKQTPLRFTQEGFEQLLSSGLSQLALGATQLAPQAFYTLKTGCSQLLRWGLMPIYNLCAPCICITLIDEISAFLLPGRKERRTGHLFRKHGVSALITLIADLPATLSFTDVAIFLSKTVCAATAGFLVLSCCLMFAWGLQLHAFITRPFRCIRHMSTSYLFVRLLALATTITSLALLAGWPLAMNSQQTPPPGGWGVSLHPHNDLSPVLRYFHHGIKPTMSTNDDTSALDVSMALRGASKLADMFPAGIFGSFAFLQKSKSQQSRAKTNAKCQFSNFLNFIVDVNGLSGNGPPSWENRQFYGSATPQCSEMAVLTPQCSEMAVLRFYDLQKCSEKIIMLVTAVSILLLTQGSRVREALCLIPSIQDVRKTLWPAFLAQADTPTAGKTTDNASLNAIRVNPITSHLGAALVGAHYLFVAFYLTSLSSTMRGVLCSHGLAIAITYVHHRIILGSYGDQLAASRSAGPRSTESENTSTTLSPGCYGAQLLAGLRSIESVDTSTTLSSMVTPREEGQQYSGTPLDYTEAGITPPPTPPQSPILAPKIVNGTQLPCWGLRGGGDSGDSVGSNNNSKSDSESEQSYGEKDDNNDDSGDSSYDNDWRFGKGSSPITLGSIFMKKCLQRLMLLGKFEYVDSLPEDMAQKRRADHSTILTKVASLVYGATSVPSDDDMGPAKFSFPKDSRNHEHLDEQLSAVGTIVKVCCVSSEHIELQQLFRALDELSITLYSEQASTATRSSLPGALTQHQQHSIMAHNDEHLQRLLRGENRLWVGGKMLYVYLLPQENSSLKEIQIRKYTGADPRQTLILSLYALGVPLAIISDILLFCMRQAGIPAAFLRIQTLKRVIHPTKLTMTRFESIEPWDPDATWSLQFADNEEYERAQTRLQQGKCSVRLLPDLSALVAPTDGHSHPNAAIVDHSFLLKSYERRSPPRGGVGVRQRESRQLHQKHSLI